MSGGPSNDSPSFSSTNISAALSSSFTIGVSTTPSISGSSVISTDTSPSSITSTTSIPASSSQQPTSSIATSIAASDSSALPSSSTSELTSNESSSTGSSSWSSSRSSSSTYPNALSTTTLSTEISSSNTRSSIGDGPSSATSSLVTETPAPSTLSSAATISPSTSAALTTSSIPQPSTTSVTNTITSATPISTASTTVFSTSTETIASDTMTDTTMPTFTTSAESSNPSTGSSSSETQSGTEISTLTGSLATETPTSSATLSSDTTNTRTSVSISATDTSSLVVIYPSSTSTTNTVTSTTLPPTYSLSDATSSAFSTAPVSFSSSETITPNPFPTETTGTTEIVSDTVTSTSPSNSTVSSTSLDSTFTVSASDISSTLSLSSSSDVDSASISTTTLISSSDSVTPYPNATFSTLFSETRFSATSLSTTSIATLATTTSGLLTFTSIPTTSSAQTSVLISENLSTAAAISTVTVTGVASESASGSTSAPTRKPVEVVITATPSASIASGLETLTELTTEFTTSTLPDGQLTTIPTHTGTTTIVTPSPTGKIEPNPILRNKAAVVGVIIAGVLVIVGGILVFLYALQKRKKRVVWRTKSPDKPYSERPGRVLIRGLSPDAVNFRRPLADQEWQPPLISEVGEDVERDDEDEQLYFQGPMTLPMVQKEEYGSIMGAVHSYGLVGTDDLESSLSSSSIGLRLPKAGGDEIGRLISFEENNETISPTATQAGDLNHGWVQADVSTPTDPFLDPDPDPNSSYSAMRSGTLKYRPLSQSSSVGGVFSPLLSQLSSPTRAIPDRLRGGTNDSIMNLSSSPVNDTLPFDPYTDLNHSSRPSSLLNPPTRPKFIGTLTDLVLNSSKSFSEPPTLPPIPPVASPSPGESMDSYHPDGLLDPALLESRSLQSTDSGSRIGREPSSESLVDHVDYTRPISSIIFHQPPTVESYMDGVEEEDRELNAHAEMDGSAAVRAYHDKLLGSRRNS